MSDELRCRVALLTGQSDRCSWALSPAQEEFLVAVGVTAAARLAANFPYLPDPPAHQRTRLAKASVNNAIAYLGSRLPSFRRTHSANVERLIASRDHTIFLAGSCGLELFNNLALPESILRRVSIFAFGPVARRRPACAHLLVGGRRDWISRFYFAHPDHVVDCGHMDYLSSPLLRRLCREFICRSAAPLAR